MRVEPYPFVSEIDFPVILTGENDLILYKNKAAYSFFRSARTGSRITRFIDNDPPAVVSDDGAVALITLFGDMSPLRRALVFDIPGDGPAKRAWCFDYSLPLVRPDTAKQLVNTLAAQRGSIFEAYADFHRSGSADSIARGVRLMYEKVCVSRDLNEKPLFPVDCLRSFFETVLTPFAESEGKTGVLICDLRSGGRKFIDFAGYMSLFVRVLSIVLSGPLGKKYSLRLVSGESTLTTTMSFAFKKPFGAEISGGIDDIGSVLPCSFLSLALLGSFTKIHGARIGYTVKAGPPCKLDVSFDFPLKSIRKNAKQFTADDLPRFYADALSSYARIVEVLLKQ